MAVAKERDVVVSEVTESALAAAGLLRLGLLRARLLRRGLLARRAVAILATAEHLHFVGADLGGNWSLPSLSCHLRVRKLPSI